MSQKKTEEDKSLIGKYIDILVDDSLHLGLYITDFEHDLEGLDQVEVVLFYNEPGAIKFIGKKEGDIIITNEEKTEILKISDHPIPNEDSLYGTITLSETKTIEFYGGWKNHDVLKSCFGLKLVSHEVCYFPLANPGMVVENRNISLKISKDIKSCEKIFNLIDNKRLEILELVFSNGLKINYEYGHFVFHFSNIAQRDEVFKHYTSMNGLSRINFNHLTINEPYNLRKIGKPEIDHKTNCIFINVSIMYHCIRKNIVFL